jgi:hypothetical protein
MEVELLDVDLVIIILLQLPLALYAQLVTNATECFEKLVPQVGTHQVLEALHVLNAV